MDPGGAEMKKYRLNKEKFTEFLAGVVMLVIVEACFITLLLKL